MKNFLSFICLFLAGGVAGMLVASRCSNKLAPVVIARDSLVFITTEVDREPEPEIVVNAGVIPVPVRDTIMRNDTVFVLLDRQQKFYSGENYRAWVSGYEPKLDSIQVDSKTVYVTETKTVSHRHAVGIFAEAGYNTDVSIPFGLEYRYMKGRWTVIGRAGYDIISGNVVVTAGGKLDLFKW